MAAWMLEVLKHSPDGGCVLNLLTNNEYRTLSPGNLESTLINICSGVARGRGKCTTGAGLGGAEGAPINRAPKAPIARRLIKDAP